MNQEIRTRFAPSPTGYLHVGGARTAIFNWLFAKKHNGKFLLRIEDTDKERSSEEMTRQIFEGLNWLGLKWDEEGIYQGARAKLHREYAQQLVRDGKAYPCFCSKEELDRKRKEAQQQKRAYRYDGTCRNLSTAEVKEKIQAGRPYAIRFKTPQGITSWEDGVHGRIEVKNTEIDDFIIIRSDGSPIYQLAVVVDDHMMGITHVIRGDDHISNTPKQILLYRAFGWEVPHFAHVPLILGPDKKRLSKRHGATSVDEYRRMGILPEALFNYLVLLGWSPGDDREIMSKEEILTAFSLKGISKNNAIFDEKKLLWMNGQYISRTSDEKLWSYVLDLLQERKLMTLPEAVAQKAYILKVIGLLKNRVKLLTDFVDSGRYFFTDPTEFDPKGLRKYFKQPQSWNYLEEFKYRLENLKNFREDTIEESLRQFAEEKGVSASKIIHPLRLAVSGRTVTPGLFEVLAILGKETVVRRLKYFISNKAQWQSLLQKTEQTD